MEHKEELLNPFHQRDCLDPFAPYEPKGEIACVENSNAGPCEDCSLATTATPSLSEADDTFFFSMGMVIIIPVGIIAAMLNPQFASFFIIVFALGAVSFFANCFLKVKDKREAKRNRISEWKRLVPSLDDGPSDPLEGHVVFEAITIPSEDHETVSFTTVTKRWSEEERGWVSATDLPPSREELDYEGETEFKIEETLSYTLIERFADYCFAVRRAHQMRYATQVRSQQTLEERKLEIETIPSYSKLISN